MSPRLSHRQGAGAASVVLALFLFGAAPAIAQEGAPETACGVLTLPESQSVLGRELLTTLAGVLDWAGPPAGESWGDIRDSLGAEGDGGGAWRIKAGPTGALQLSDRLARDTPEAQAFALDVAFDLNRLRRASAQPFSDGLRGRVLDAVAIDNARRARVSVLAPSPETEGALSAVLFTESRAEPPGEWIAAPLATVRWAETEADRDARPLEVDFGEQWGAVVFGAANLALAIDPDPGTISAAERMWAWGPERIKALQALAGSLGPRLWVWRGGEDISWVCAIPLRDGVREASVAGTLRSIFGERLGWERDGSGRATATLDVSTDRGAATDPRRGVALRFITIGERTAIVCAPDAAALQSAPEVLAGLLR